MNQVTKKNAIALAVIVAVGGLIYVSGEDIPAPASTPASTPAVVTVETISESEAKALASKDAGIDLINLGEETVLPEIAGYDNPTVDDLPPLTLDGSHLPDIVGYESPSADELPPLES
tara:strand:- start:213 stop:566 length:354 start_codon:yes stop_codon:yes gene_type:complete